MLIFISRYFLCQFESFFSQLFIFNKYALAYYWMGYKFNAMIIHLHNKKIENKRKNDSSVGCSSCFCGSERHFQTNPSPIEKIQWYQIILKTHRFKKTRFIFLSFQFLLREFLKRLLYCKNNVLWQVSRQSNVTQFVFLSIAKQKWTRAERSSFWQLCPRIINFLVWLFFEVTLFTNQKLDYEVKHRFDDWNKRN